MKIEDSNSSGFFVKKFDANSINAPNDASTNLMNVSNDGQLSVNSLLLSTKSNNSPNALADLGLSSFGTVNITISDSSTISYTRGVINGTYTVKVKLNGHTINTESISPVFNFVNNTITSPTYAIIKVNVLSDNDNDKLYFTDITYY